MGLYSVVEGTSTPFPSVLTGGQVDSREISNVGTMQMDLHVNDVAARNLVLVDGALIILGGCVKLDNIEKGRFRAPGSAPVVCLIVRYTRRTWARHVMLTNGITFLQRRRQSTRRCTSFEQGWCR
jgi:hypothetical protein